MDKFKMDEYIALKKAISENNSDVWYTILVELTEKYMSGTIHSYYESSSELKNYDTEKDMLSEVNLHIIKKCVTHFFCKEDKTPERDTPEGFMAWIKTTTVHLMADKWRKLHKNADIVPDTSVDEYLSNEDNSTSDEDETARNEILNEAFSIAIESDSEIHIIIGWLAVSLMVLNKNIEKKEATGAVAEEFKNQTLFSLRDFIISSAANYPWLEMNDSQRDKIDKALNKETKDGQIIGKKLFSDYFTVAGGKASLSKWCYRINSHIKLVNGNETSND